MAKSKPKISALQEKDGIDPPAPTNRQAISNLRQSRKKELSPDTLIQGILAHDITSLSRGITLIESTHPDHQENAQKVIQGCLPYANQSIRIGITGVPGVGKSTFIESFGKYLTGKGKKVAVLAVDPSSSISHGSILGDKTRMEELVKDANAYIRPSASGESLGGVARKTREAIILCEAAGFDTLIIETVGVGQSETAVHSMVDFFLLLKLAGAGDELQGIKRGIMEMADAIVINKADGDNVKHARLAKTEFNRAMHLFPPKASGWQPTVTTCSAITHEGIKDIWQIIEKYHAHVVSNGFFNEKRADQNLFWMMETINEQLKSRFFNHPDIIKALEKAKTAVHSNKISPFQAAQELLHMYFNT